MPVSLVDPTVQAQGAGVPQSPLSSMMGQMVGAYGRAFPTAAERARMQLEQAQTQQVQQQTGAGSNLAHTVANILASQQPSTSTAEAPRPSPGFVGPEPSVTTTTPGMSTGDAMRSGLPDLVRYAAESGDVGKAGGLGLLVSSYLPGSAKDIAAQRPGEPTTQDMAMMGSGHPYAATPGGVLQERTLGTPEMRNRNFKIQQIMNSQGATEQQAAAIVDGVVEGGLDPVTRQPYIVNKLDLMRQGGGAPSGGNNPAPAPTGGQADDLNSVFGSGAGYPVTPMDPGAASPSPAAAPSLRATSKDLAIDTGSTYGSAGLKTQVSGMMGAMTDPTATNPAQIASGKVGNMKADYLGLLESSGRQSDTSRGYLTSALPPTGKPTDMEAAWEKLTTSSGTAQQLGVNALNKILSMREDDQKIVSSPGKYAPDIVKASMANIIKEDRFIKNYGGPDLQNSYQQHYYGGNAPAAPASNLTQGNAMTAAPGTKVNVIAPDGVTTGSTTAKELPRLLTLGYKVRP